MIRRPVIAPGLHVLTDPGGIVQLGMAPQHRLRVPDTPAVRRTLAILTRGEALPASREVLRARALLEPALCDGDALLRSEIGAADVAASTLRHRAGAKARLNAREEARVAVRGDLGVDISSLLNAVGLGRRPPALREATVALVLSSGEPARDELDDLVRAELPHLIVRALESDIVVGPFVVPGQTACLRCCDLHRADLEPAHLALLAETIAANRTDGVCSPLDTAQCWVALGLAVGDLVRYVEGDQPMTWSRLLVVDEPRAPSTAELWPPHPDCSCTWTSPSNDWSVGLHRSATMEV